MYFANVQYIHDRLRKYVARAGQYSEAAGMPLQYLLLDMSPVTHIDSTGGVTCFSKRFTIACVAETGLQVMCKMQCTAVAATRHEPRHTP
jgi:hypothetical protein